MPKYHITLRRDTSANFATHNPTPLSGEFCYETDTKRIKVGDGVTQYTSLQYFTLQPATTTEAGLMSAQDKIKLNGIAPSSYAPIASPEFTGTPKATIPEVVDISNRIATTASAWGVMGANLRDSVKLVFGVTADSEYPVINDEGLQSLTAMYVNGQAVVPQKQAYLKAGANVVEYTFKDYSSILSDAYIPAGAFADIAYIEEAYIPAHILGIGAYAFANTDIAKLYAMGMTAPAIEADTFAGSVLENGGSVLRHEAAADQYNAAWTFGCIFSNLV